jgi:hypothetical protein
MCIVSQCLPHMGCPTSSQPSSTQHTLYQPQAGLEGRLITGNKHCEQYASVNNAPLSQSAKYLEAICAGQIVCANTNGSTRRAVAAEAGAAGPAAWRSAVAPGVSPRQGCAYTSRYGRERFHAGTGGRCESRRGSFPTDTVSKRVLRCA